MFLKLLLNQGHLVLSSSLLLLREGESHSSLSFMYIRAEHFFDQSTIKIALDIITHTHT